MADNSFPVAQGGQEHDSSSALATTDGSQSKDLVAQNTESMSESGSDDADSSESSGIRGFFKDGEMLHRLIILGFLVIFVAAIIFAVISFSSSGKTPDSERRLGLQLRILAVYSIFWKMRAISTDYPVILFQ